MKAEEKMLFNFPICEGWRRFCGQGITKEYEKWRGVVKEVIKGRYSQMGRGETKGYEKI